MSYYRRFRIAKAPARGASNHTSPCTMIPHSSTLGKPLSRRLDSILTYSPAAAHTLFAGVRGMVVISWRVMGFFAGAALTAYLLSRRCDPAGRSGQLVRRALWALVLLGTLSRVIR